MDSTEKSKKGPTPERKAARTAFRREKRKAQRRAKQPTCECALYFPDHPVHWQGICRVWQSRYRCSPYQACVVHVLQFSNRFLSTPFHAKPYDNHKLYISFLYSLLSELLQLLSRVLDLCLR